MNENKTLPTAIRTAGVFIVIAGIFLILIYGRGLLIPIVISAYIAMLLFPFVNFLERKRVPRVLAITIGIIVSLAVVAGVIWFFVDQISRFSADLPDIQSRFDELTLELSEWLHEYLGIDQKIAYNDLDKKVFTYLQQNAASVSNMAFNTIGNLALVVLIPVYIFMFLLYRDHFTEFCTRTFKKDDPQHVLEVVTDLRKVIQKYISGMLKVMMILAAMNALAFYLLGLKHALFFAVFAAILNVVPYVGPLVGSIIPITYALLTKDSLWYPIGVFISFHVIQTIEGNFLTPKIVGSNVSLNPVSSLVALLLGGYVWGVAGMIIFIPAAAILKRLLELSPSTETYGFLMGEEDKQIRRRQSILNRWIQRRKARESAQS